MTIVVLLNVLLLAVLVVGFLLVLFGYGALGAPVLLVGLLVLIIEMVGCIGGSNGR